MAKLKIDYRPNFSGVHRLLMGPEMRAMLHGRAEQGKRFAESIAPVGGPDDPHRGEYKSSFVVEDGTYRGRRGEERPEARLANVSSYGAYVEWLDGYHVLARTVDYIEGRNR
ncbi:MAG: hypothetical protein ACRDMV_25340 [Streptosporangiales bacterium]